jgi:hypothetical protein
MGLEMYARQSAESLRLIHRLAGVAGMMPGELDKSASMVHMLRRSSVHIEMEQKMTWCDGMLSSLGLEVMAYAHTTGRMCDWAGTTQQGRGLSVRSCSEQLTTSGLVHAWLIIRNCVTICTALRHSVKYVSEQSRQSSYSSPINSLPAL